MMEKFGALALAAGLALALPACTSTSSSTSTSTSSASDTSMSSAASAAPAESTAAAPAASAMAAAGGADGAQLYQTNCSSCHGASGQGLVGAFPPLAGNPVVSGDSVKVIHIVKYGLAGPVQVAGKTYNGQMPPWSPTLSDASIAAVIDYVRASWGNSGAAVTPAQVTAVAK